MISPATFDFLTELNSNNNREWFQANKSRHDSARGNVLEFAGKLIENLSKFDLSIASDIDPRNCIMRIYRDVRFSNDKTPYKTNFGLGFSEFGKNFKVAGYYLHIHPEYSFLAGGSWMPEADILKSIRQEIDYNGNDFHQIIDDKSFKRYFGEPDSQYKLKTPPKGYFCDHPDIEYLKLKSFTFSHPLVKLELSNSDAVKQISEGFILLYPFIAFLRNATL